MHKLLRMYEISMPGVRVIYQLWTLIPECGDNSY